MLYCLIANTLPEKSKKEREVKYGQIAGFNSIGDFYSFVIAFSKYG